MKKGYSGNADFEFEIERYKDKETGALYLESDLPDFDDKEFEFEYVLISLSVSGNSYFTPGKYHGAWEDSYPDEGDTEIESVTDENGKDWSQLLTEYETNAILERIAEFAQDSSYDYDPPDDIYYDDPRDDYIYDP